MPGFPKVKVLQTASKFTVVENKLWSPIVAEGRSRFPGKKWIILSIFSQVPGLIPTSKLCRGETFADWFIYLSICLPVFLSVSRSVGRSVSWSVCLSACLPACLPACLSVCLSVGLSVSLSLSLSLPHTHTHTRVRLEIDGSSSTVVPCALAK